MLPAYMQAVIFSGTPYDVQVATVPTPSLLNPQDAIVRMKTSALCGTDLHIYHGLNSPHVPLILGHEGVGVVVEVGSAVDYHHVGDYVIVPDTVDSGHLEMDGPAFDIFGLGRGPNGGLDGLQAEYARVPYADDTLIPVPFDRPNSTTLETLTLLSDILPTAWQSLDFSGFQSGDTVAVFGAGPVGLLAAYSAILRGATSVYVVDQVPARLDIARSLGAVAIDFTNTDAVAEILRHQDGGVDRSVDCVGLEAENASGQLDQGIVLQAMINVTRVNGGLGIVGAYNPQGFAEANTRAAKIHDEVDYPLSMVWSKGLSIRGGAVNPRAIAPGIIDLVTAGTVHPHFVHSATIDITQAPEYYRRFSERKEVKVFIRFDW